MQKFLVKGGRPLHGSINISGSKNAALPILAATLLTEEECTLHNVPDISDIHSLITLLRALGAKVHFENNTIKIHAAKLKNTFLDHGMVGKMRASVLLAGPLLARLQKVDMEFPGGCVLGKRSLWAHTYGFQQMGAEVVDDSKKLYIKTKKLKSAKIVMTEMSVTATENILMAAVLAEGITDIRLAACEPHVQDLCIFLIKMGAKIQGVGTHHLIVEGVKQLHGADHAICGDYLEAGTFAIAAAITHGEVEITGIETVFLDSFWQKMEEAGVPLEIKEYSIKVLPAKKLKAVQMLKTAVYPGFPTDLQAPFAILLTQAKGVSKVFETLFEGRLNYLFELEKMGAKVEFLNPHQAIIIGPTPLKAVPIASVDIRAGAAMVLASLIAKGQVEISNIKYIDRGYQALDEKLRSLGADIVRVNETADVEKQSHAPAHSAHPHRRARAR